MYYFICCKNTTLTNLFKRNLLIYFIRNWKIN